MADIEAAVADTLARLAVDEADVEVLAERPAGSRRGPHYHHHVGRRRNCGQAMVDKLARMPRRQAAAKPVPAAAPAGPDLDPVALLSTVLGLVATAAAGVRSGR